jgi:peptide/nickel transport system permease protein
MKPTLIQFTGLLGTYFGALLGGSFIIEMIFGWSGLGTLTLESLHRRDYPVVESALWVTSFFILFFTMMGDYLQECLTPHS